MTSENAALFGAVDAGMNSISRFLDKALLMLDGNAPHSALANISDARDQMDALYLQAKELIEKKKPWPRRSRPQDIREGA